MARAGLKKVVKSVRGKRDSVRRTYWVKSNPNTPTLLQRAGRAAKTAAKGAVGLGAVTAAGILARRSMSGLQNSDRARKAFATAKSALLNARKGTGADLAHHLLSEGGAHAASHLGSRFGQVAGTAVGGMVAGPAGAALGGWLGSAAGGFLGSRHAAPHVARGADWLRARIRGNG